MNKNAYETYEFLPTNTSETEPDQFFVVQNDGTFLINRQIQYVAQVEDVKEVLEDVQPCTVYGVGVSSQQFFVDVDNSAELISVSDQFILPDADSSLYTNSYLLQPSSSTNAEQMEEDVAVDQYKEPDTQDVDIDLATHNSKQGNNFTEITLSDEQYQKLEQKGWILLESNDKIFVLNTLGLHDITTNDKLIQKLKNEIEDGTTTAIDPGSFKIESVSSEFSHLVAPSFSNQQDTVEFVIGSNEEQDDAIGNLQFVIGEPDKCDIENAETIINHEEQMDMSDDNGGPKLDNSINEIATIKQASLNNTSSIKIKTKFNFKEIPEKIVLGKTINGKKIVAKVVKTLTNTNSNIICNKPPAPDESAANEKVAENTNYNVGMSETELVSLIQQAVRRRPEDKPSPEDVKSAENVIAQLLKVPNLKHSLIGHHLIITKAKNNKDEFGMIYNRSNVALVSGRVSEEEDSSAFEHIPDLLQSIRARSAENFCTENDHLESIYHEKEICTIFHVHITETKCADNIVRVSVTLNKRQLSLNQMFDLKKRHPNRVFGCSACATLFKSEEALQDHQHNNCLGTGEAVTIDTGEADIIVDAYALIRNEKDKSFSCKQCNTKFTKLYSCVRHVKTHLGLQNPKLNTKEDDTVNESTSVGAMPMKATKQVYKCKMCRSTYFHPATLSKHIVSRHIKVKSK